MNIQIIDGKKYIKPTNGHAYSKGFGGIRRINYSVDSGTFSNPETFKANSYVKVDFYESIEAMNSNLEPLYTLDFNLKDLEIAEIIIIDPVKGVGFFEKDIYDYVLTLDGYKDIFEIA